MSIEQSVTINTFYTRAVNLERDNNSESVINAYVPTTRALSTLKNIVSSLDNPRAPCSWSLIGPYGSGKSVFGVYLSHLLGNPSTEISQLAQQKLKQFDKGLAEQFSSHALKTKGYCSILLTGSPEQLGRRLVSAMHAKALSIWSSRKGANPKFIDQLKVLSKRAERPSTTEVIDAIGLLQKNLQALNYKGILILIDELGKFLEYEARHSDGSDIFLLQAIAEETVSEHAVKLSFVVMLHQSFDQYARGMNESLKNEWSKVQGRFESVPFLESAEQTLHIVSKAIKHDISSTEEKMLAAQSKQIANKLYDAVAIPGTIDAETAADLFKKCYPLHPVTSLLLPLLCHKVAQNERTLFSYLGSQESFGFQESLKNIDNLGDWVLPSDLYEYFINNQSSVLTDHMTSRRWAEVVTAVERLGDAPQTEIQLVKIIGLLNIVGNQSGFKASKVLLEQCFDKKVTVKNALASLQEKSIIKYRKFSSEYRVWQGSDFDLDANIEIELSKLGDFDLSEALNDRHNLLPIIARRYSIEQGAIRYFVPSFVNHKTINLIEKESEEARLFIYLSESQSDQESFNHFIKTMVSKRDMAVLCEDSNNLKASVAEVTALDNINASSPILASDPVAQHEFTDRYKAASLIEKKLVSEFLKSPQNYNWYWDNQKQTIKTQRDLQSVLSLVLKNVYFKAPKILNELVNKDKPSSQANGAKNKLAMAMFKNESLEDLGFEKYPPEKSIYRAVFLESRLHQKIDGQWKFFAPISAQEKDDPCHIFPVWQRLDEFLKTTDEKAKSLVELNKELIAPPYGIKEGVLPMLYMALLIINKNELAIYENGIYCPYLIDEQIERFLKRPDLFTIQKFELTGVNESIHASYSKGLFNDNKSRSLLSLAKPVAAFVLNLPEYTKKTKEKQFISQRAQAVRNVIQLAKSPIKLMLEGLPAALDINIAKAKTDATEIEELSSRLMESIKELKYCLSNMENSFSKDLADCFGLNKSSELSKLKMDVAGRCSGLEEYTIDQGLLGFIKITQETKLNDETWLSKLLSFLIQKPTEKWSDTDRLAAQYTLKDNVRKINELEQLRLQFNKHTNTNDNFDVYLVRAIKKGSIGNDEVVVVDKTKHHLIKQIKSDVENHLNTLANDDLRFAVMAEILNESLDRLRSKPETKSSVKRQKIAKTLKSGG